MNKLALRLKDFIPRSPGNERGITGLETAIVLIAFVVVSSVFAFAALSTGLFSADKSKETISAGLSEARGTLEMRGSVIAKSNSTGDVVDEILFQVANAAGGEAVDVNPGETIIVYTDASQTTTLVSGDFTTTGIGGADADTLVEPGEMYEFVLTGLEAKLGTDLKTRTKFTFEVKPSKGAVLHIERTTPIVIDTVMDLG